MTTRIASSLLCALFTLAGCRSEASDGVETTAGPESTAGGAPVGERTSPWAEPTVLRVGGPALRAEWTAPSGAAYLTVGLVRVDNPARAPLLFELTAELPSGERRELRTFAPFPPDNPARFVVGGMDRLPPGTWLELALLGTDSPLDTTGVTATVGPLEVSPSDT